MRRVPLIRPFDYVAVLFSAAIVALAAAAVYATPQKNAQVVIESAGKNWVYPLDAEEKVLIPGPLGDTVVVIHDHSARIESSPCPNQTCVAAGAIHEHGQWSACLPNGVFVRIDGIPEKDGLDGHTW